MSANNQTLIKSHKGKYLVFSNVNAESWNDVNILDERDALEYRTFEGAYEMAEQFESQEPTEYGIQKDRLFKDSGEVIIK